MEVLSIFKKLFSFAVVAMLIFTLAIPQAEAASRVFSVTSTEANELGPTVTTSEIVTRSQLQSFYDEVAYAESRTNELDNFRYAVGTSILLAPLRRIGVSVGAGSVAGGISSFIINNQLGSATIQDALFNSVSSTFTVTVQYTRHNRGSWDYWYEASFISIY